VSTDARATGRSIGLLLFFHMIGAFVLNAVVLPPIFRAPGFLEHAVQMPARLPLAMMLGLALTLIFLAVAILARPIYRLVNEPLALAYLLIVTVGIVLTVGENVGLFAMQNVSETNAVEPVAHGVRVIAASVRNGAHFSSVFVAGIGLLLNFLILFRGRLVPRLLAGFGVLAVLAQMFTVAQPFFGGASDARLLAPLGVAQLGLAFWLLAKGFREPVSASVAASRH
jgi:hypothetical protein